MKLKLYKSRIRLTLAAITMGCLIALPGMVNAQDNPEAKTEEAPAAVKPKPVKNTFQSVWIIENQTVMVPIKKTFEMDIMHRFGLWSKGYEDFWGFFAPSNIRLGFSYVPIDKLNLGIGVTKTTMATIPYGTKPSSVAGPMWDASAKYAIIKQTKGVYPVSITYYGNVGYNTKKDPNHEIYLNYSDRMTYFNQLIIARKINDKLSVQVAPSHSHQNLVNGYFVKLDSANLKTKPEMNHDQFSISLAARYRVTKVTSLIMNYDQPITKHTKNNPNPNFSFGVEFNTSSHAFQLFFTSYQYLVPQVNSLYNTNDPLNHKVKADGGYPFSPEFLIGFNITRLWNY